MTVGFASLEDDLESLKKQNIYRSRRLVSSSQGVCIEIDGKKVINFSSNNYLGLANHPEVIESFKKATNQYGVGTGSAHLICGHTSSHHALEEELAAFTGRDRVLLFSTGFMANIGIISALLTRGDFVFEDRLNHASLLDGGLLSGAIFKRYMHKDIENLQTKIKLSKRKSLIVTDGVFSMDGDLALLPELSLTAKKNKAWLMVDDAHGFGVLGATGGGIVEHYGLSQQDVAVLMGTLGKSFGTFGAFVAGSEILIETLIQKARSYVFTTALPAAIAEATRTSLRILMVENWRRDKLLKLANRFTLGAKQIGLQILPSASAIQPLLIGDSQSAIRLSNDLLDKGFLVSAIRPPTVAKGQARLRITFSANHDEQQIDQLLDALESTAL
ncbi:MAG: 8-amino-7-oxononanoate synthase [Methylococcales symbiont of Iophon sp. n. MRB-2018]|nr:MAG: 8-amino-7-oxononanoate synthase [Methylococcales symbiont of Iophon sp. n. MRB-2018]KAF3978966.1 MAG: 8-amino-7-oxononanoate synthase [Methylococcales symbiont of Iophon sp. n. MRB-2018]